MPVKALCDPAKKKKIWKMDANQQIFNGDICLLQHMLFFYACNLCLFAKIATQPKPEACQYTVLPFLQ
jgi:hypothetical protein